MRSRVPTPDLHQHLGFPTREDEAYKPKHTHSDLDRVVEEYERHSHPLPTHTHSAPSCVLTKAANQTIPDTTETLVQLDTVLWDPLSMRSGNSIVIPETGLWHVAGGAYWATHNSGFGVGGQRSIHIVRTRGGVAATVLDEHVSAGAPDANGNSTMVGPGHYPSRYYPLQAGDILTMEVLHQAFPGQPGGTRSLIATGHNPTLSATLVAR